MLKLGIEHKWQFLIVMNIFLLVLGMLMEGFSAILVAVPLILPFVADLGMRHPDEKMSPFQLAMIFLLNLEIAYCMPPLGLNLFISSFRFNRPVASLYRVVLPFVGILGIGLVLVSYVPWYSNVAVAGDIAAAHAKAEKEGAPPRDAWMMECVQEDPTNPQPCSAEDRAKYPNGQMPAPAGAAPGGTTDDTLDQTATSTPGATRTSAPALRRRTAVTEARPSLGAALARGARVVAHLGHVVAHAPGGGDSSFSIRQLLLNSLVAVHAVPRECARGHFAQTRRRRRRIEKLGPPPPGALGERWCRDASAMFCLASIAVHRFRTLFHRLSIAVHAAPSSLGRLSIVVMGSVPRSVGSRSRSMGSERSFGRLSIVVHGLRSSFGRLSIVVHGLRSSFGRLSIAVHGLRRSFGRLLNAADRLRPLFGRLSIAMDRLRALFGRLSIAMDRLRSRCAGHPAGARRLRADPRTYSLIFFQLPPANFALMTTAARHA